MWVIPPFSLQGQRTSSEWLTHRRPGEVSAVLGAFTKCQEQCLSWSVAFTVPALFMFSRVKQLICPSVWAALIFGLTAFIFPVRKRWSHESLALLPSLGLSTKHRCCYKAVKHPTAKQLRGSKRTGWFCFFSKSSSELSAEWRCHIKMPFCTSAFP